MGILDIFEELRFILELLIAEQMIAWNFARRKNSFWLKLCLGMVLLAGIAVLYPIPKDLLSARNLIVRVAFSVGWYILTAVFSMLHLKICYDLSWCDMLFIGIAGYSIQHIEYVIINEIFAIGICPDIPDHFLLYAFVCIVSAAGLYTAVAKIFIPKLKACGGRLYEDEPGRIVFLSCMLVVLLMSSFMCQSFFLAGDMYGDSVNYLGAVSDLFNCMLVLLVLLVDEWGFDGFVVSDWGGSNDHALGVQNGSHLEMPSTGRAGAGELVKAVREGKLDEKVIDQRLDELLTVIFALHQAAEERKESDRKYDADKHHEFAKKAARESIVLLKNDENILPLKPKSKVTVIGDFAKTPRYQGAGSSLVNAVKVDTTLDLINSYGLILDRYVQGYERNCPANAKLLEQAAAAAKDAEYVLIYAGLDEISESEGMDREHMRMPDSQVKLIEAAAEVNQNVIVILSAGSAVEMPWIGRVKAVVHGYLSGQAGAGAMLEVLTGKHNPCGRLNETYPLKYADTPAYHYFPGKQRNSEYRESIFIGYRYYETAGKAVQFPFGFGLSYTTFSYSDLKADKTGAVFQIMNTGDMEGAEIAQLYVRKKSSRIFRADRELKGFQKVHLKPGETKTVTILFDDKTFRYFDMETNGWEMEEGEYEILIGRNASDIVLQEKLFVQGSNAKKIYSMEQLPSYFSADIQNVDDSQFEQVLGTAIPDGSWGADGKIGMNDAICQMYYAKSRLARLVYHILTKLKKRSEARGKPNLNILFIYNMPFRGVAKMTGGSITVPMAEALVEMVNGKFFSGLRHLIKAARER